MNSEMSNPHKEKHFTEVAEQVKLPVFYLLLAGAYAGWQSFYNVHLDDIGYSSIQIGALNAIFISTSALVVPFWGMLADKFGNNRTLLLLTTVTGILVFLIGQTLTFQWMIIFNISAVLFITLSVFNLVTMPVRPVAGRSLVNFNSFSSFLKTGNCYSAEHVSWIHHCILPDWSSGVRPATHSRSPEDHRAGAYLGVSFRCRSDTWEFNVGIFT